MTRSFIEEEEEYLKEEGKGRGWRKGREGVARVTLSAYNTWPRAVALGSHCRLCYLVPERIFEVRYAILCLLFMYVYGYEFFLSVDQCLLVVCQSNSLLIYLHCLFVCQNIYVYLPIHPSIKEEYNNLLVSTYLSVRQENLLVPIKA